MEPLERHFLGLSQAGFHRNAYWAWPAAADAPRLIAMHGLTRNGRDFDAVARALSPRYQVICPDVVGRGHSDWFPDGALYGYPQYLADATVLIAAMGGGPVDWLGTSMGGIAGMLVAAQKNTPIRRLILNDVGALIPEAALQRIGGYVGLNPHFADLGEVEAYLRLVHAPFGRLTDAEWAGMAVHSARAREGGGYGLAYDPAIAQAFAAVTADVDLWPVWDRIACPVLILRGGTSDLLLSETAMEMVRRKPGTTLIEFSECGHAPALNTAEQIAAIGDWLARTAP